MEVRELMDALGPSATAEQASALLEHPKTEEAHVLAVLRKRDLPSAYDFGASPGEPIVLEGALEGHK